MSKMTKVKTNKRAVTSAIDGLINAYESAGVATAKIDTSAKTLGETFDNNGLAMLVTINAKPNAKFENWAKTWAGAFGKDAATTQQTYDLCREHLAVLREKHAKLLKAGTTTEAFNTMLQRVRKHMFLSKTDKNKSKDARKRAALKGNKSLFAKVNKARPQSNSSGSSSTPKVTANSFDAKHAAIVKKIEELQKAFAPINAFVTDAHDDRAITKASSEIVHALSDMLTNLETIKGEKK
jgi:hypothetical protein